MYVNTPMACLDIFLNYNVYCIGHRYCLKVRYMYFYTFNYF